MQKFCLQNFAKFFFLPRNAASVEKQIFEKFKQFFKLYVACKGEKCMGPIISNFFEHGMGEGKRLQDPLHPSDIQTMKRANYAGPSHINYSVNIAILVSLVKIPPTVIRNVDRCCIPP